jgi:hypothetical protein
MGKIQEKNMNIRPLFGHFWETFAKILPQIYMAAYIFTRPLLSYAAEESASWYHWRMVASLLNTCRVVYLTRLVPLGCYSETGFHIGMDRNFVH